MLYCRVIHITIVLHVLMRGSCTIQANLCLIIIVRVECLSMKFISSRLRVMQLICCSGKILCWYEQKDTPKQYLYSTNAVYNKCNI